MRAAVFDAIRPMMPDRKFTDAQVLIVDGALDALGVPKETAAVSSHPQATDGALRPSPACFAIIKEFEGYEKKLPNGDCEAYPDPGSGGDPWTIGFGSTGPGIRRGVVWTRQQAEDRLASDVTKFAQGVASRIGGAATTQGEFDAMVSLAYNIGLGNFEGSTLLRKHKADDKAAAALQFSAWNKASGRIMSGLTRRRAAEAKLYRGER